MKVNTKTW